MSQYTWAPDAEIKMKGKDFEILNNNIMLFLSGECTNVSAIMGMANVYTSLQKTIKDNIATGVITLQEQEVKQKETMTTEL